MTQFLLGAGLLAVASCGRPEQVLAPPHLLSKEEVTSLLVQFHLLESRIESSRLASDSARALFQTMHDDILRQHKLKPADSTFERSYRYYAMNGKDLDGIYAVVVDSLTAREKKMGATSLPLHH
ncbi:hypothetical protein GCM10023172_12180 [Hymenobacter ginsengisoli]|uniref:DUF4296 domain-containing protein n=1 Tax=Hymenobacter ginsengisoli TaxID=1051626 RepID=A0ABP8Q5P6_9BACT|nr:MULTISPECIES: DUF4296 domain-containing protein [unclassified Hymenobacter]MBO2031804.1 DUF4296 domain-containing protein [Hymenobacter sp. BT559]